MIHTYRRRRTAGSVVDANDMKSVNTIVELRLVEDTQKVQVHVLNIMVEFPVRAVEKLLWKGQKNDSSRTD